MGALCLLDTALGLYWCLRVCFGLNYGPSALGGSLGILLEAVRKIMLSGMVSVYVDDLLVGGTGPNCIRNSRLALLCMAFCGFEVQLTKLQAICRQSEVATFNVEDIGVTLSTSCSILRTKVGYDGDMFYVSCQRQARLSKCRDLLEECRADNALITKTMIFELCGGLAYDPLMMHAEARVASDGLRSLIGKWFSESGWSQKCLVSSLPPSQLAGYHSLIEWMTRRAECFFLSSPPYSLPFE